MKSQPSALMRLLYGSTRVLRARCSAWRILSLQLGHGRSVRSGTPLDGRGQEIPWFTYPAIEYLSQLDFSERIVFEFGAGNSSVFWNRRAARVVSVEHDRGWFGRLRERLPSNHELHLVEDPARYSQVLAQQTEQFDVIVVDGIERRACCEAAVSRLKSGGLVILDNADWHPRCAEVLRGGGLLEVDFSGFGPVNGYTWTTSLFFHREFAFRTRKSYQPLHGIGSLPHLEKHNDRGSHELQST